MELYAIFVDVWIKQYYLKYIRFQTWSNESCTWKETSLSFLQRLKQKCLIQSDLKVIKMISPTQDQFLSSICKDEYLMLNKDASLP